MTLRFWIGVGVLALISLGSVFYQRYVRMPRCEYDGSEIAAIYESTIVLKDGSSKKFCSIYCAKRWFDHRADSVDHVIVTDETRGNKVESSMAYFVKSDLVTNRTNGNRIHAFQRRQEALAHAGKFNGSPAEDPFEVNR